MMARPSSEHPTELELMILKILWGASPLPVREIRRLLAAEGRVLAHTSVITTLNIMVRKRTLKRAKKGNAFLFAPSVSQKGVSGRMLGDVVRRVFDGSVKAVVEALLESSDVDADELLELRRYINRKARETSP